MMFNSRIITHEFNYHTADSLNAVLNLLQQFGERAKILAGGTDLVGELKKGRATPDEIIDIGKLDELKGLGVKDGRFVIGAANNFRSVMDYFAVNGPHRALYEAILSIGKTQVLNMGTVGGNIANGSPKADSAPPLLTFEAEVRLVKKDKERTVSLIDFFKGPNRTVMEPQELLVSIEFEQLPSNCASAFEKKTRVGADISKISCAVTLCRQGSKCVWCRIALGAAAPVPMRMHKAEKMLKGRKIEQDLLADTARQVTLEIKPPQRGRISAEYRRHLAGVIFKDAFNRAWNACKGTSL